jgi:hypothetical protein
MPGMDWRDFKKWKRKKERHSYDYDHEGEEEYIWREAMGSKITSSTWLNSQSTDFELEKLGSSRLISEKTTLDYHFRKLPWKWEW